SLKPAGKKDKCRKKSGAEKRESKEHRRSSADHSAKTVHRRRRKSGSKVTVPSSERDISTLKECNESPPSTPVGGKRGRGAENRPSRAPEKKSRDDRSATTHRSSKKRISYKDERPVETIDLGGSDYRYSTPQAEEEEEHDRSTPEKSDGAEDEEGGNEADDNGPSRGQSQDTDEDDNSDGKSASQSTGEDRSAASEGDDSPSPSRTWRSEGERQARNGSDTEESVGDRQIMQHVSVTGKGKKPASHSLPSHSRAANPVPPRGASLHARKRVLVNALLIAESSNYQVLYSEQGAELLTLSCALCLVFPCPSQRQERKRAQGPNDEGAVLAKKMKGKLLRSVAKAFAFSSANDATLYPTEDTFFAEVQATAKLAGGTAEEGLRSHIAKRGIRDVIGECNRIPAS
ncbi:hypothetical protein CBR_g50806, partial [Chara braunii]